MIEIVNRVGYDVMTMGNHELGYICDYRKSSFYPLGGLEIETDKLPALKPYVILKIHNVHTIAVPGLTGGEFDNREGVSLRNPSEVAGNTHILQRNTIP